MGGAAENTLKKLNGAKLGTPFSSIVDAKAIGRGPTAPNKYWCTFGIGNSFGSYVLNVCVIAGTKLKQKIPQQPDLHVKFSQSINKKIMHHRL